MGIKSPSSELPQTHVFSCPIYILDPALWDSKKLPKWDSNSHLGIFVGFSDEHTSLVPLVFNLCTQHILHQYHVIFDDAFSTIPSLTSAAAHDLRFTDLFETSHEFYVDPSGIVNSVPLQHEEWLSPEDRLDPVFPSACLPSLPPVPVVAPHNSSSPPDGLLAPLHPVPTPITVENSVAPVLPPPASMS